MLCSRSPEMDPFHLYSFFRDSVDPYAEFSLSHLDAIAKNQTQKKQNRLNISSKDLAPLDQHLIFSIQNKMIALKEDSKVGS